MLHRLANLNDAAALIFGTTMTISGPVLADAAAPLPGAEYLTPFGLLMVVLWAVGAMVRKIQADSAKQTDEYIKALLEQNKKNAEIAHEATATVIQINRDSVSCMEATKNAMESTRNTVQDLERVVIESQKINQDMSLAVNRQLQHAAELIEQWSRKFPCVAMQSEEGRQMLARKVKEKEAE